jgi:hypothetical protein
MIATIKTNEDKEAELINQAIIAKSSITNLEETVTILTLKLQELTEQLASKKDVRINEQVVTTNAPFKPIKPIGGLRIIRSSIEESLLMKLMKKVILIHLDNNILN